MRAADKADFVSRRADAMIEGCYIRQQQSKDGGERGFENVFVFWVLYEVFEIEMMLEEDEISNVVE